MAEARAETTFDTRKALEDLLSACKSASRSERAVIKNAFLLAADAHKFQKRLSGEPYFIHPVAVARTLAGLEQDYQTIAAALLHDVIEDTGVTRDYIEKEFGTVIAHLVDGVTKISRLRSQGIDTDQGQSIRKMILATTQDVRVLIIKLADKLHNMETLGFQKPEKVARIAREVLEIYAPLAGRLGIYKIKFQLEDLALQHLYPEQYSLIAGHIDEKLAARDDRIKVLISILDTRLRESRIRTRVEGRSKHFYSIFRKMQEQHKDLHEIYDLSGIRILVDSVQDCYAALGIVHTIWNPVPGRFKDYIAVPKSNGYQSIHTTVVTTDGTLLEIQIRTHQMHLVSEFGVAAHWAYKEKARPESLYEQQKLMENLLQLQDPSGDPLYFLEDLRTNLSSEQEVYVFTPKGQILSFPKGATVLDFAFRIHTDLGLRCSGAKIANRLVSIRTPLKSGDQVHIITNSGVHPTANWLLFLKTAHARAKVRSWLKKEETPGTEAEERIPTRGKSPARPEQNGGAAQGRENSGNSVVIRDGHALVTWNGETGMMVRFAQCCSPVPGDRIQGFITTGKGISVHKADCPSILSLAAAEGTRERVVALNWTGVVESFPVKIVIEGSDRPQIYLDLVHTLAHSGANIKEANASTRKDGHIHDTFTIEVDTLEHLEEILSALRRVEGVQVARRLSNEN